MKILKLHTTLKRDKFTFEANFEINTVVTGVYGPSGSGKTTLLHSIAGLQIPDTGKIQLNEEILLDSDLKVNVPVHHRRIGYVFQEGRLFPHLNVEQNLKFAFKKSSDKDFSEIVKLLELEELLGQRPYQLSGGQKQRVAIGRALLANSQLLLLDEPFSALDNTLKKQIIHYLNKIIEVYQVPIVLVSHNLKDLLMLTDNIILIENGKVSKPQTYYDLVISGNLVQLDKSIRNYYNIFDTTVIKTNPDYKIVETLPKNSPDCPIVVEMEKDQVQVGDTLRVSLRAADVTIALKRIDGVSMRNQLQGRVQQLIENPSHMVCLVDCGIPIIVRLTNDACHQLELEVGKEVWCLFKSLAIETYL